MLLIVQIELGIGSLACTDTSNDDDAHFNFKMKNKID